ncbi:MAG: hypothetical protein M1823_005392 [Watsoniomyces obsoletus]|nr:MAG: hypothetical protein M1823_005392 [Watsoniomyces obsoletus]
MDIPTTPAEQPPRRRRASSSRHHRSDAATEALVRRTLCPQLASGGSGKDRIKPPSIEELLPPLTSSDEVDLQLYGLIAIIIRDVVDPWYGRITTDRAFVDELVRVMAHCTRGLEQRLRQVDLEALFLDELPAVVDAHLLAHRTAHHPLHPPPLVPNPRQAYHMLLPHPALSPVPDPNRPVSVREQGDNEAAYRRLLVRGVLVLLLPSEDWENECVRTLVEEIAAEMILGHMVAGRMSQGRFWREAIIKGFNSRKNGPKHPAIAQNGGQREETSSRATLGKSSARPPVWSTAVRNFLRYALIAWSIIRFLLVSMMAYPSLSPRRSSLSQPGLPGSSERTSPAKLAGPQRREKRPMLSMSIWSCISHTLNLPRRMPWLDGFLQLLRHGLLSGLGRVGDTDRPLDRILSHQVSTYLLTPAHLLAVLRALRSMLDNPQESSEASPGTSRSNPDSSRTTGPAAAAPRIPPGSDDDTLKRQCAESILAVLPTSIFVRDTYLSDGLNPDGKPGFSALPDKNPDKDAHHEMHLRVITSGLSIFDDSYLTKHLIYATVELVVVRLFPELEEKSVTEIIASMK